MKVSNKRTQLSSPALLHLEKTIAELHRLATTCKVPRRGVNREFFFAVQILAREAECLLDTYLYYESERNH